MRLTMPKVLYLSPRELTTTETFGVINALELYAAEPQHPPAHIRSGRNGFDADRHHATILAGYATAEAFGRIALDTAKIHGKAVSGDEGYTAKP